MSFPINFDVVILSIRLSCRLSYNTKLAVIVDISKQSAVIFFISFGLVETQLIRNTPDVCNVLSRGVGVVTI